jgi:hypothetical protein
MSKNFRWTQDGWESYGDPTPEPKKRDLSEKEKINRYLKQKERIDKKVTRIRVRLGKGISYFTLTMGALAIYHCTLNIRSIWRRGV